MREVTTKVKVRTMKKNENFREVTHLIKFTTLVSIHFSSFKISFPQVVFCQE